MPRKKHSTQEEKITTVKKFDTVFANRLSDFIKTRKKEKSTEQLANDLGVTVRIIQLWEGKQSRPDIERLIEIADYFRVTVDYLVGRSDIPAITNEIAAACELTGLNEDAVRNLRFRNNISKPHCHFKYFIHHIICFIPFFIVTRNKCFTLNYPHFNIFIN